MRASRRISRHRRLHALAALLAGLLVISQSPAAHAQTHTQPHHGLHRGVVAAALAVTDNPTGHLRTDHPVAATGAPAANELARAIAGPADSSGSVSSRTASTPPARGPPLKAAA